MYLIRCRIKNTGVRDMGISYVHAFSFCLPSLMSQLADFILGFSGGFFSPFLSFVVML